jgi:hypothetical protein
MSRNDYGTLIARQEVEDIVVFLFLDKNRISYFIK